MQLAKRITVLGLLAAAPAIAACRQARAPSPLPIMVQVETAEGAPFRFRVSVDAKAAPHDSWLHVWIADPRVVADREETLTELDASLAVVATSTPADEGTCESFPTIFESARATVHDRPVVDHLALCFDADPRCPTWSRDPRDASRLVATVVWTPGIDLSARRIDQLQVATTFGQSDARPPDWSPKIRSLPTSWTLPDTAFAPDHAGLARENTMLLASLDGYRWAKHRTADDTIPGHCLEALRAIDLGWEPVQPEVFTARDLRLVSYDGTVVVESTAHRWRVRVVDPSSTNCRVDSILDVEPRKPATYVLLTVSCPTLGEYRAYGYCGGGSEVFWSLLRLPYDPSGPSTSVARIASCAEDEEEISGSGPAAAGRTFEKRIRTRDDACIAVRFDSSAKEPDLAREACPPSQ